MTLGVYVQAAVLFLWEVARQRPILNNKLIKVSVKRVCRKRAILIRKKKREWIKPLL